jgi:hypothetical protein
MVVETLAMEALATNAMKKKTEALKMIKEAIAKNFTNFTCWHVLGIINRSNKYVSLC